MPAPCSTVGSRAACCAETAVGQVSAKASAEISAGSANSDAKDEVRAVEAVLGRFGKSFPGDKRWFPG
jgi:hypothetical protein